MRKRVKAGLIGCGAISPTHLRAFKENDVELVATCDIIEERAARRAEEYGDPNTRVIIDYHDLLAIDEIELVVTITNLVLMLYDLIEAFGGYRRIHPIAKDITNPQDWVINL